MTDYRALADFRYAIRKFLRFSESAAREAGMEPQQHQLLLAVKGMPEGIRANIGEIAERLQIQHHSTVELVDRLTERGLVARKRSSEDRREVIVQLTAKGEKLLRDLSIHHRNELQETGPGLVQVLRRIMSSSGKPAPAKKRTSRSDVATSSS